MSSEIRDIPSTKGCLGPCNRDLPLEMYGKHPSGRYGRQPRCKQCAYEAIKQWRLDNPERLREQARLYRMRHPEKCDDYWKAYSQTDKGKFGCWKQTLRQIYGLTPEDYDEMLMSQGGACAICGKTPDQEGARLHIDHNHSDGSIRGLLCGNCNRALGMLFENQDALLKAVDYLAYWNENPSTRTIRQRQPAKRVSAEAARQLRSAGFSHRRIAEFLKCSQAAVAKILKGWPECLFPECAGGPVVSAA